MCLCEATDSKELGGFYRYFTVMQSITDSVRSKWNTGRTPKGSRNRNRWEKFTVFQCSASCVCNSFPVVERHILFLCYLIDVFLSKHGWILSGITCSRVTFYTPFIKSFETLDRSFEKSNWSFKKGKIQAEAYENTNRSYDKNLHTTLRELNFRHFGWCHRKKILWSTDRQAILCCLNYDDMLIILGWMTVSSYTTHRYMKEP